MDSHVDHEGKHSALPHLPRDSLDLIALADSHHPAAAFPGLIGGDHARADLKEVCFREPWGEDRYYAVLALGRHATCRREIRQVVSANHHHHAAVLIAEAGPDLGDPGAQKHGDGVADEPKQILHENVSNPRGLWWIEH